MSAETFESMCRVIAEKTPHCRLEFAQSGEPTLHPHLLQFISTARRITPTTQIQVTTNGLTLLNGRITHRDIFNAGADSVYVDMYGERQKHIEMAQASGAEWYLYDDPRNTGTPGHKMANTFYKDRGMNLVILQDNPEFRIRWRRSGRLSTFLNHIDWKVAIPYGLLPVRRPYQRKCTLPMRYVSLSYEGDYIFCCIDFWCESAGLLGNVNDGPDGFEKYWFGRTVQSIRRQIVVGNRAAVPYCSRCNCAFSKCDWVKMWPLDTYDKYWDGESWRVMPPPEFDYEVFADGWKKARAANRLLPPIETEMALLASSPKRIIKSSKAFD